MVSKTNNLLGAEKSLVAVIQEKETLAKQLVKIEIVSFSWTNTVSR